MTPPTSSADQAADALQRGDPLGADADPEEIMRHLRSMPPPTPPQFNVQHNPPPQPQRPMPRAVAEAQRLWTEQPQPMPAPPRDQVTLAMQVIGTARAISTIVAARILLLIALLCAAALWGVTIYDPLQNRIISAGIFSAVVLWPLIMLALRKG